MQLDDIQINFSEDSLLLMNLCLAFLMFGIALDMKVSNFRNVFQEPKLVLVGLTSQLILLPIFTLILIYFWQPPPSVALGLLLVSVCPGGNVSNFAVHLAKGNTALSVSLTSIVTLSAAMITPLAFEGWANFIPESESILQQISISLPKMIRIIFLLILLPLVLGMTLNHFFPLTIGKIKKPIRLLSIALFASFIVFAVLGNIEIIRHHLHHVLLIVIIHNIGAYLIGYWFPTALRFRKADARAISIETGIQNAGLGLVIIFNFFDGIGGMTLIAAWWGIWDLISVFCLAAFWSKR